jgi:hypothetical protein
VELGHTGRPQSLLLLSGERERLGHNVRRHPTGQLQRTPVDLTEVERVREHAENGTDSLQQIGKFRDVLVFGDQLAALFGGCGSHSVQVLLLASPSEAVVRTVELGHTGRPQSLLLLSGERERLGHNVRRHPTGQLQRTPVDLTEVERVREHAENGTDSLQQIGKFRDVLVFGDQLAVRL